MSEKAGIETLINLVHAQSLALVCLYESLAQQTPEIARAGLAAMHRVASATPPNPGIQQQMRWLIQNIEAQISKPPMH